MGFVNGKSHRKEQLTVIGIGQRTGGQIPLCRIGQPADLVHGGQHLVPVEAGGLLTVAQGLGFYKVFWMFFICSLLGDWIETVYVYLVSGVLMSRSSVIYGTFSLVWGLGGALFTVVLQPLRERNDRMVFLGGFFLGGAFEYLCSVFTEVVFGTVFWDYSDMPFNIQGRTNLLFMFFWGVLALVWVKAVYPRLNRWIERIPPVTGTVLTWCLVVFMVLNALLSGMAMGRYIERQAGAAEQTLLGAFLDSQYPDSVIEFLWPNMRIRP